jgi:thiamine-phosphate pyrophosphorylase
VAALCGADGVHVGQDDLPPEKVRAFAGSKLLIGHSTHNPDQVTLADTLPLDYIAIGPVFPTHTKENPDAVIGLDVVRAVRNLTQKPLVAIGGITLANAPSVLAAGADAVAVISGLVREAEIAVRLRTFFQMLRDRCTG